MLTQNPTRALTYMEELRTACFDLARIPDAFEILEISNHSGIRRRVFSPYLIFYRADASQVKILRVIHGARDYLQVLDQLI